MLKTALLILTMAQGDATRVTLSEADSLSDCEASLDVLSQILTEAGNPPIAAICGETALRLEPFIHGTPPEAEIHRYRVEVPNGNGYRIAPLAKDETCTPDLAADPAVYCAQSGQGVLTDG
ncbi:hypothetical protein [Celeribacter sp.]|uniref:hypothetical protein n=1 Tax=Celeribacter sp. TaxID=1890673 RepID=UPI003A8CB37D